MGEIIFFVILTAFLLFKLYGIFNKSDESELDEDLKEKYSRFIWFFEGKSTTEDETDKKSPEGDKSLENVIEADVLEGSLEDKVVREVRTVFPNFNPEKFKKSASMVYAMLFDALSTGKVADIRDLVTPEIFKQLEGTYNAFLEKEEALINTDIDVQKMEFSNFDASGEKCFLTVSITAKRCCYVKSQTDGTVTKGSSDKFSSFEEVWCFEKAKGSTDPVWLVSFIDQK